MIKQVCRSKAGEGWQVGSLAIWQSAPSILYPLFPWKQGAYACRRAQNLAQRSAPAHADFARVPICDVLNTEPHIRRHHSLHLQHGQGRTSMVELCRERCARTEGVVLCKGGLYTKADAAICW